MGSTNRAPLGLDHLTVVPANAGSTDADHGETDRSAATR
jgi:hypothetical protein